MSCVRTLVDAGADVNVRDYEGNTSLYYASSSKFTSSSSLLHNKKTHNAKNTAEVGEISQLLSKTNADSRIKEIKMIMPINEEQQHVSKIDEEKVNKVISLMIEKGAKVNFENKNRQSPLHVVVKQGNSKLIQILIENGAKINVKDKNGQTPLHIAVAKGNNEIIWHLIEYNAYANWSGNNRLLSHLDIAETEGLYETVNFYSKNNARFNSENSDLLKQQFILEMTQKSLIIKFLIEFCSDGNNIDKGNPSDLEKEKTEGLLNIINVQYIEKGASVHSLKILI